MTSVEFHKMLDPRVHVTSQLLWYSTAQDPILDFNNKLSQNSTESKHLRGYNLKPFTVTFHGILFSVQYIVPQYIVPENVGHTDTITDSCSKSVG